MPAEFLASTHSARYNSPGITDAQAGTVMQQSANRAANIDTVVEIMRNLSRLTDPQEASALYGQSLDRLNMMPCDRYLSLSRRGLDAPLYRITRNTDWAIRPNPWKEKEKLPLLSGGLLAEILYSNKAVIVNNLQETMAPDDPARPHVSGMNLLIALPHFDGGEAINAGVLLANDPATVPLDELPMMIWQANLWGRATLNLVNKQKLDEAYRSLDSELRVVGEIQKSLLPRTLPRMANVDIAVHYQTSQRAGGDYYDFFPLPDDCWGIFVADVSGHGTPAAVMMAVTHAIAHSHPGHPMPPGQVLAYLNRHLVERYTGNTGTFITAFYGVLDPVRRTLTFSSAGHPSPRLIRNGRAQEICHVAGYPLGIMPDESYEEHTISLAAADRLVLYTDGIVEAFSPEGDLFGVARLDAATARGAAVARGLVDNVLQDMGTFTANGPLTDDQTLLAMVLA